FVVFRHLISPLGRSSPGSIRKNLERYRICYLDRGFGHRGRYFDLELVLAHGTVLDGHLHDRRRRREIYAVNGYADGWIQLCEDCYQLGAAMHGAVADEKAKTSTDGEGARLAPDGNALLAHAVQ